MLSDYSICFVSNENLEPFDITSLVVRLRCWESGVIILNSVNIWMEELSTILILTTQILPINMPNILFKKTTLIWSAYHSVSSMLT